MRVNYILPALQPAISNEAPASTEVVPSFREHVVMGPIPLQGGWEQQFRLDARPFTASYIGPPPRPHSLCLDSFQTQRARWHNLVSRYGAMADSISTPAGYIDKPAIRIMIDMLRQMQQIEDSIVAQQGAISRG